MEVLSKQLKTIIIRLLLVFYTFIKLVSFVLVKRQFSGNFLFKISLKRKENQNFS